MTELLFTLGALTLGGSAAIAALAWFSRASRARYGARWRCWAWLLLCLRLALPLPLAPQLQEQTHAPIQIPTPTDTVIYHRPAPTPALPPATLPNDPDLSTPVQPVTPPTGDQSAVDAPAPTPQPAPSGDFTLSLSQAAALAWLLGVGVMTLWLLTAHLRFLAYLRRWGQPLTDPETVQLYNQMGDLLKLDRRPRLTTCPGLKAPMLAGLFHPTLLLPEEGLSGDDLRCSLLHELTHHRRRDIWLKALALWVNVIHWFNPLMWYMVKLVERDTELACDEEALRHLPPEEHAAYGRTILEAVARLKT